MIPTYTLLTLALAALWAGGQEARGAAAWRRHLWWLLFGAALVAALGAGIVRPLGLVWLAGFALAARAHARAATGAWPRRTAATALVLLAAGLMTHQLPGFNNPRVLDGVRFTPDAVPYRLHLNFDKAAVALLLLGCCHVRLASPTDWRRMLRQAVPAAAGLLGVILVASLALGYVRFAPKWPAETGLWLWANLCFTCCAEEALFRGFVQGGLARAWRHRPGGAGLALAAAAVLFGVAHAAGGPVYVLLATGAGAGYGWSYHRTGRIEAAILCHFAVNTTHFLLFTYPALARPD